MNILKTMLAAVLLSACAAAVHAQKAGGGTEPRGAGLPAETQKGAQKAHKAFLLGDEIVLQMPEPLAQALRAGEGGPKVVAELNGVGVGRVRNQIKTIDGVITTASAAEGAGETMADEAVRKFLKAQMADQAKEKGLRRFLLVKTEGIWKEGDSLKVIVLHPERQEFTFKVSAARKKLKEEPGKAPAGKPSLDSHGRAAS